MLHVHYIADETTVASHPEASHQSFETPPTAPPTATTLPVAQSNLTDLETAMQEAGDLWRGGGGGVGREREERVQIYHILFTVRGGSFSPDDTTSSPIETKTSAPKKREELKNPDKEVPLVTATDDVTVRKDDVIAEGSGEESPNVEEWVVL